MLGWRDVPIDEDHVGDTANASRPYIRQLFIEAGPGFEHDQDAFERKLYVIRRIVELAVGPDFYAPSCSSRTLVYKGMLKAPPAAQLLPRPAGRALRQSALALVHSRFSTNTFPSWELAHPYRVICHNGEINTLMGNVNWMRARESQLASELFGIDLQKVLPVVRPGGSDSATFDNVLELLMLAGRSLPHAVMMMIPEAYQDRDDLSDELKGFYAFHSCLMEPWDGPAAVCLHRRPRRRRDAGPQRPAPRALGRDQGRLRHPRLGDRDAQRRARRTSSASGRLQPGKIFLVDLEQGRIVEDEEVKRAIVDAEALQRAGSTSTSCTSTTSSRRRRGARPSCRCARASSPSATRRRTCASCIAPMARAGEEPIGSMGNDAALAVLSDQRPPLFSYFKQLFAQVTNPPIDPIRESIVMSLGTGVGAEGNLLDETPEHAHQLVMDQPILRNAELETLRSVSTDVFRAHTIDITWPVDEGPAGMQKRLANVCDEATDAHRGRASTSSSCPTAPSAPSARRSRRCWPSPPCTTTSCARARACARASCSSPASRARSTTSRRSSATARARSTRT